MLRVFANGSTAARHAIRHLEREIPSRKSGLEQCAWPGGVGNRPADCLYPSPETKVEDHAVSPLRLRSWVTAAAISVRRLTRCPPSSAIPWRM